MRNNVAAQKLRKMATEARRLGNAADLVAGMLEKNDNSKLEPSLHSLGQCTVGLLGTINDFHDYLKQALGAK
jgi:hypothetical protein